MPSKQSRNVKVQSRPVSSRVSDEQLFYELDYELNRSNKFGSYQNGTHANMCICETYGFFQIGNQYE